MKFCDVGRGLCWGFFLSGSLVFGAFSHDGTRFFLLLLSSVAVFFKVLASFILIYVFMVFLYYYIYITLVLFVFICIRGISRFSDLTAPWPG